MLAVKSCTPALLISLSLMAAGCSSVLPKSKEASDSGSTAWQSFSQAEQTFDQIVPGSTTVAELAALHLDPKTNPNITRLPRFEVMQRFVVNQSVSLADLDEGVRECLQADSQCVGWEVNHTASQKRRNGNVVFDMLKMRRVTQTDGWRFTGLLLIKGDVVVYKLTGGQPHTREVAETEDVLGPLQALGNKLNALNGIDVTDVRNGIKAGTTGNSGHVEPVTAVRIKR